MAMATALPRAPSDTEASVLACHQDGVRARSYPTPSGDGCWRSSAHATAQRGTSTPPRTGSGPGTGSRRHRRPRIQTTQPIRKQRRNPDAAGVPAGPSSTTSREGSPSPKAARDETPKSPGSPGGPKRPASPRAEYPRYAGLSCAGASRRRTWSCSTRRQLHQMPIH